MQNYNNYWLPNNLRIFGADPIAMAEYEVMYQELLNERERANEEDRMVSHYLGCDTWKVDEDLVRLRKRVQKFHKKWKWDRNLK